MPVNLNHIVVLEESGNIVCVGENGVGQLGTRDVWTRMDFIVVPVPTKFVSIAAGHENHTVAVAEDGSLWGWGLNEVGQIGLGPNIANTNIPTKIPDTFGFKFVCAGDRFSVGLDQYGSLWSFGSNFFGQLGLGDYKDRYVPSQILSLPPVQQVACGKSHIVALDFDGHVWSIGLNNCGQLGLGPVLESVCPSQVENIPLARAVACGEAHSLVVDVMGHVWGFGSNSVGQVATDHKTNFPVKISDLDHAVRVWCGGETSFVQTEQGNFIVFGSNSHSQLIFNQRSRSVNVRANPDLKGKTIIPGKQHTIVVNPDGSASLYGEVNGISPRLDPSIKLNAVYPDPLLTRISQVKSAHK